MVSKQSTAMERSRYPPLTADQENEVTGLVELLKKTYDPLPQQLLALQQYHLQTEGTASDDAATATFFSPIRNYCYHFLISREWDRQKAFEMMQLCVSYREKHELDSRAELPSAVCCRGWDQEKVRIALGKPTRPTNQRLDRLSASIEHHFTFGLHYWDKHGQPVVYLNLGSVDEPGLLKTLKQLSNIGQTPNMVMWELVQHLVGVQEQLLLYQQMQYVAGKLKADADDGLIRSSTMIVDLSRLNYKMLWKPALDLFMNTIQTLFQYYPKCVHQVLLVNSPSLVTFAYKLVRSVLPESVQKKVYIANTSDTPAIMQEFIDAQYVPDYLGGLCHCEGGCVRGYNPHGKGRREGNGTSNSNTSSIPSSGLDDEAGAVTEDITLKPGQELRRTFSLKKAESVVWQFLSANGHDVAFAAYFVPEQEAQRIDTSALPTSMLEPYLLFRARPSEGSDQYTANDDGLLVIVWDNTKSWFRATHLQLNVFKQAADLTDAVPTTDAFENEKTHAHGGVTD
ncbi:hypothetical protein, conserved [Leishmania tarentolae]|uniref:Uncharacterized protein n=1 Tax=Leishmania tarentolae TaxID=5689 RepID=A0A640KNA0_LEITA|nr:hypothetical protein, conserved [Leishmania tarentolae]